jgi:hypothetical protein
LLSPFKQRKDFSELSEVQEKARRNLSNPLSEGSTDMTSGPAYYDPHAEVRTEQVDAGVGVNNQEGQNGSTDPNVLLLIKQMANQNEMMKRQQDFSDRQNKELLNQLAEASRRQVLVSERQELRDIKISSAKTDFMRKMNDVVRTNPVKKFTGTISEMSDFALNEWIDEATVKMEAVKPLVRPLTEIIKKLRNALLSPSKR